MQWFFRVLLLLPRMHYIKKWIGTTNMEGDQAMISLIKQNKTLLETFHFDEFLPSWVLARVGMLLACTWALKLTKNQAHMH